MGTIQIQPHKGTEAYETIKNLEFLGFEFSGPGFFVSSIGFRGFLYAKKGETWCQIDCYGSEDPVFRITTNAEPFGPDPSDESSDYNSAAEWAGQPTPYDP